MNVFDCVKAVQNLPLHQSYFLVLHQHSLNYEEFDNLEQYDRFLRSCCK